MKLYKILFCLLFLLSCQHKTPTEPNGKNQLPQWPMFGGNLRNTANAADPVDYYSGPENGEIIWTVQFGFSELCWSSPSIGLDGTIYIATTPIRAADDTVGSVYAINPEGTIKWRFKTEAGNLAEGAVGIDGTYYIGSKDKYFYAIDRNGFLKWRRLFSVFYISQQPAITEKGEIIVPVGSGIIALDGETGEDIWFYETTGINGNGISIDQGGNIYAVTSNGMLSLSPEGQYRWDFSTSLRPNTALIANDGTIIFTVISDTLLYALRPDGTIRWTFDLNGWGRDDVNPAISSDGTIIALNAGRIPTKIYKLSPDGQLIWEVEIAQLLGIDHFSVNNATPIIDQMGSIYLAIGRTGGDNFYALNHDGSLKWSLTIDNPSVTIFPKPAITADGIMYVAGDYSINAIR